MLKFKRPCLSISNNLIFTASPTDSTSFTLLTRSQANCEICTKPSRPGANSTKAPKLTYKFTAGATGCVRATETSQTAIGSDDDLDEMERAADTLISDEILSARPPFDLLKESVSYEGSTENTYSELTIEYSVLYRD